MYIKSIVIDGFKSYAQRTEIFGFDPMFNAITGLNGSGKSNILDSICFLLGISNLSQVRASSLQELVYKGGQAGVTKATVTITFDNGEKDQSPVGYEMYDEIVVSRQVVIGGRNKYLINGTNATPSRVQDLFRSVQLNVNNPHFLIMQGRITKVLNMKPVEILSMIEEAAGTRMYESKRTAAQRTIEKKDTKLKEIDTVLAEEITPTLRKLKEERSSFLEYQKTVQEIEHLSRLHVAHQFMMAENLRMRSVGDVETMKRDMDDMRQSQVEMDQAVVELTQKIKMLEMRKEKESRSVLHELEKAVEEQAKALAVVGSSLKNSKEQLKKEQANKKALVKACDDDTSVLSSKEKEKAAINMEEIQKKYDEAVEAMNSAKKHFQAVSVGMSTTADGQAETLAQQKMTCESQISTATTVIKQAQMRLKSHQSELKEKEKSWKESEKSYKKEREALSAIENQLAKLDDELKSLDYSDGSEERLQADREQLQAEVGVIKKKIEAIESRFPQLCFDYSDPCPGFDQKKVKGPVARLVHLKCNAPTALEVVAGGKLYNIIVDTESTGKGLLEKGQLKRRYTIIPLNKIVSKTIPSDKVKRAKALVGDQEARPALSLVGYDGELQAAMAYVFGSSFVCDSMENAKKVTFDKNILTRSVTLAGEVFDPSGTLTGGSRPSSSSVLSEVQKLLELEKELQEKTQQLLKTEQQLEEVHKVASKYNELKEQRDLKSREADLVRSRLEQSTLHQQLTHLESLRESIAQDEESVRAARESEKAAKARLVEIQQNMKDSKSHHERELKNAEKEMNRTKKEAEQIQKFFKTKEQEWQALEMEMNELRASIASQEEQVAACEDVIKALSAEVDSHKEHEMEAKETLKKSKDELDKKKSVLREQNRELHEAEAEKVKIEKEKASVGLNLKGLEHKVSKSQKDSREAAQRVEALLSKHEWIATDRQYFGKANTAYDFGANNPDTVSRRLTKLEEQKEKLSKSVNMRAMNMLGQAEEKYNDLIKKKKIVENDKSKIAAVIAELDQKKNEALQSAWRQVNKDFGSIFSTLLPGTDAKLEPPEGQTVLDGLEVRVAFSGVWKESLTELSGGQRSLVALSLILSMLLFKPAPLYILDEVDAALDLSHTQNIGQMLKTHFRRSQFIVVSLKEGMFNNANVVYRTKFIDGVSTVTRHANPRAVAHSKEARKT
jgi:structural maintenance of chromosome 2